MNFTQYSDIGFFDIFTHWHPIFFGAFGLASLLLLAYLRLSDKLVNVIIAGMSLFIMVSGVFLGWSHQVSDVRSDNVMEKFNVSESDLLNAHNLNNLELPYEGGNFADFVTSVRDREKQSIHEVTFGFTDSGEPFIYENGTVDAEFIEGLKK